MCIIASLQQPLNKETQKVVNMTTDKLKRNTKTILKRWEIRYKATYNKWDKEQHGRPRPNNINGYIKCQWTKHSN